MTSINTLINYTNNTAGNKILPATFPNNWEDVESYNHAVITINYTGAEAGVLHLQWSNTARTNFPNINDIDATDNDIIASENINIENGTLVTLTRDHRAGWFRLKFTTGGAITDLTISTLYKLNSGEIKIADKKGNVSGTHTLISEGSMHVIASDTEVNTLKTTVVGDSGNALYVNLNDSESISMATVGDIAGDRALATGFADATGLGISADASGIWVSATNDKGLSQATTEMVKNGSGVAQYISMADNYGAIISSTSTTNITPNNSMQVALVSKDGSLNDFSTGLEPLYVKNMSTGPDNGVDTFDLQNGVATDITTVVPNNRVSLYNLFVYNNGVTTTWLRLYDMSQGYLNQVVNGSIQAISFYNTGAAIPMLTADPTIVNNGYGPGVYVSNVVQANNADASGGQIKYTLSKQLTNNSIYASIMYDEPTGRWRIISPLPDTNYTTYSLSLINYSQITDSAEPTITGVRGGYRIIADDRPYIDISYNGVQIVGSATKDRDIIFNCGISSLGYEPPKIAYFKNNNVDVSVYISVSPITVESRGKNYNSETVCTINGSTTGVAGHMPIPIKVIVTSEQFQTNTLSATIKYNIACGPKDVRDIAMIKGTEFKNGLYLRASYDNVYNSVRGPTTSDQLFVNGTIAKATGTVV